MCDHNKKIRDIFVGYPGSVHDARVFRTSPFYETLPNKCDNHFIIGDSAYPCLPHLLTPFKDNGFLTRPQQNYNFLLSRSRYIIEHCFGLLKQRFRSLYHLKLKNIGEIVHFIRACAVLHNLCIDDEFIPEGEVPVQDIVEIGNVEENYEEDNRNGINRRNLVMNNLQIVI